MKYKAELSLIPPYPFIYSVLDRDANEVIEEEFGRTLDFAQMFRDQSVRVDYKNLSPYTEFTVNEFGDIMNDTYFRQWWDEWRYGRVDFIHPAVVFSALVDKMLIIEGTYRIFLAEGLKDDNYVYRKG